MTKSKICKGVLIAVSCVVVVFGIVLVYYFSTTMSVQGCIDYCLENTSRNATEFDRLGDGRYVEDYAYFIATDGDSSKPQEVFVFKRKFFGSISAFDRYEFVTSSTPSGKEGEDKFGAIQFFTVNDDGEEEKDATLLFFGATKDSDITEYEYTLTVREGSSVYRGTVHKSDSFWFVMFNGLRSDEDYKKVISDVKFYDRNGDLVGIW